MTADNAKRGVISRSQLLCILVSSRLYSLLLSSLSVTDITVYYTISAVLCFLALSVEKTVKKCRSINFFLGIISILLMLQTVMTYIVFIKTEVHPHFSSVLLVLLIIASVIYAAYLKIEPLARFSSFCAAVLILSALTAVVTNFSNMSVANFKAVNFETYFDLYTCIKCFDLPVVYLLLCRFTREKPAKALKLSVVVAYIAAFVCVIAVSAVAGNAAKIYGYPFFNLFRLSEIGSFSRLDIIFTGSMILALFLKCSVLLYCGIIGISGDGFEKNMHTIKHNRA